MGDRMSPKKQTDLRVHQMQTQMTRADTLRSIAEFGKVVPYDQQAALRLKNKKKKKGFRIPIISDIADALERK